IYQSVQPATTPDALLWQRLGTKTHALIAEHIGDIEVGKGGATTIVLDEESIRQLKLLGFDDIGDVSGGEEPKSKTPSADDVLVSIQRRLEARLAANPLHPTYRSLAERLDSLRQTQIESAEDSVKFLQQLLEIARAVVQTEREQIEEEGAAAVVDGAAQTDSASLLPEQRVGALTQIFREYAPEEKPEIIERVVLEIDAVVMQVRFPSWQTSRQGDRQVKISIRAALNKFGLPAQGELFDRAYAYVAEHY
ncbi:MAG: type I restriction endonuclease subunit R, partial [Gaiellaceae bacterium]